MAKKRKDFKDVPLPLRSPCKTPSNAHAQGFFGVDTLSSLETKRSKISMFSFGKTRQVELDLNSGAVSHMAYLSIKKMVVFGGEKLSFLKYSSQKAQISEKKLDLSFSSIVTSSQGHIIILEKPSLLPTAFDIKLHRLKPNENSDSCLGPQPVSPELSNSGLPLPRTRSPPSTLLYQSALNEFSLFMVPSMMASVIKVSHPENTSNLNFKFAFMPPNSVSTVYFLANTEPSLKEPSKEVFLKCQLKKKVICFDCETLCNSGKIS